MNINWKVGLGLLVAIFGFIGGLFLTHIWNEPSWVSNIAIGVGVLLFLIIQISLFYRWSKRRIKIRWYYYLAVMVFWLTPLLTFGLLKVLGNLKNWSVLIVCGIIFVLTLGGLFVKLVVLRDTTLYFWEKLREIK